MKRTFSTLLLHTFALIILSLSFYSTDKTIVIEKTKDTFDFVEEMKKLELPKPNQYDLDYLKEEYERETKAKAFQLLNNYVGKYGKDCYYVAIQFVKELKGFETYELKKINEKDLQCGDLIYYSNNGKGQTHWAVYLDYETALQGRWTNNINIIGKVHYDSFAKPKFYRVIEKGE